ncbi:MAG: efflux RND transporter periplasmic adaptor subunit [Gammaproteobacteria bacterium]
MRVNQLVVSMLLLCNALAQAQGFIPLSEEDIARLGIVFAPVTNLDRQSGNRYPATVINSPESASDVVVPFQGTLERWHAVPGETVGIGQLLATLRSQEVVDLQNRWLAAYSEIELAEYMVERNRQLYEKGIVARQRLEEAEHDLSQVRTALNSLTGILARGGHNDQSLARLMDSPEDFGLFTLRAPIGGTLTARSINAGQTAEKYQVVASLGSGAQPWLRARVPARYADRLQPGRVLNLSSVSASVTLRYRDFSVHETTQTIEVLAEFNQPVDYLPGQVLNLILPASEAGMLVPGDAVVHSGDNTVVFVRTVDGVEARVLDLEPAGSNYVAGPQLRVGDQLVIQGASVLKGVQLGLGQDE